jgi:hypothetical protein
LDALAEMGLVEFIVGNNGSQGCALNIAQCLGRAAAQSAKSVAAAVDEEWRA